MPYGLSPHPVLYRMKALHRNWYKGVIDML